MDKPQKSPEAYRTISEVSDQLDVPQHVLRFWESKFPQVAPMKRAGNRRYYDLAHIKLLSRIRDLLYVEGYTTKGVQKLLEEGRLMQDDQSTPAPAETSGNLMTLTAKKDPGTNVESKSGVKEPDNEQRNVVAIRGLIISAKETLEKALS